MIEKHNDEPSEDGVPENVVLTPRQTEVLGYLSRGLPNKEIAKLMNLSTATVKIHVSGLLLRLRASSRLDAVVRAHKLGLI
ncbi:MAG TPA: hypothetical protein DCX19_06085 [Alphaproteobacteria bacterium]|nr:hypothetical protein [Alphaproteobacteria bacterium]